MRVPLSVPIPVKNDAANLRSCLRSVALPMKSWWSTPRAQIRPRMSRKKRAQPSSSLPWQGGFPRKKHPLCPATKDLVKLRFTFRDGIALDSSSC